MNQKIRTSAQAVLPLRIPQMGEIPQKYLEKIQKNSGFENSEFEREREGERERERDPHLCSGSATPQNPPDGGNPSTMYLEKIQKNSEYEN